MLRHKTISYIGLAILISGTLITIISRLTGLSPVLENNAELLFTFGLMIWAFGEIKKQKSDES